MPFGIRPPNIRLGGDQPILDPNNTDPYTLPLTPSDLANYANMLPSDPAQMGSVPPVESNAGAPYVTPQAIPTNTFNVSPTGFDTQAYQAPPAQPPQTDIAGLLAALQGGGGLAGGGSTSSDSFLSTLLDQLGPAPEAPQFDPKQVAQDQLRLQYGGQEAALKNAMQNLANSQQTQQAQQSMYGQTADTKLQGIYDALRNDLTRSMGQEADVYGKTAGSVRSSYDESQDALARLNNQIIQQLGGSAKGLGIEQGMGAPLERIMSAYQTMAGGNLQNKATSLAGLSEDQANALGLARSQIAQAANAGATQRGDVARGVQSSLANLALQGQQQQGGLQSQLTELEQQKLAAYQNLLQQLQQSQYNQSRQSRQDRLSEMTQLGSLQSQKSNLDLRQQQANNQYALGVANLALQQDKLQQQYAKENDPLKRAQLAAQIGLIGAQTDYYANKGNPVPKAPYGDVLEEYLSSPQEGYWGEEGAGPVFRTSVNDLINQANQAKVTGSDPLQWALSQAPTFGTSSGHPGLDSDAIKKAITRYYRGG